jgi:uncharacterized membrane protein YhaH (DUF805 family)
MNWYVAVIKKYAVFKGRAGRKEYWYFLLFNTILTILFTVVDKAIGHYDQDVGIGIFSGLYGVFCLLPSLAVAIRRLHDTNRTGWWILFGLVPIIGPIVLLVFTLLGSDPAENEYGLPPGSIVAEQA